MSEFSIYKGDFMVLVAIRKPENLCFLLKKHHHILYKIISIKKMMTEDDDLLPVALGSKMKRKCMYFSVKHDFLFRLNNVFCLLEIHLVIFCCKLCFAPRKVKQ